MEYPGQLNPERNVRLTHVAMIASLTQSLIYLELSGQVQHSYQMRDAVTSAKVRAKCMIVQKSKDIFPATDVYTLHFALEYCLL